VKKEGKSLLDTELVRGVIVDKEVVHPGMPRRVEKAKIVLLDTALEMEKTEFSAEIKISNPQQMQVELVDARGVFSADGQPLDYSSSLAVYQGGELVKRCVSTVNSPCSYNGYRFFQAGYFGFGAAVEVRDTSTGNVVYKETLALSDTLPSPRVVITGADGRGLLDRSLVLADVLSTEDFVYYGTLVRLEGGRLLSIGAQQPAGGSEWRLVALELGGSDAAGLLLRHEPEIGWEEAGNHCD